ncbi:MAG: protein kinase [Myxococcota bacterium]
MELYYTLSISIYRNGEAYQVQISHTDPNSDAQIAPMRGRALFDETELLRVQELHDEYGQMLARQLFADDEVRHRFIQVETAAQSQESFLRILVCIDPSAQELQALRWELLCHPQTGAILSTSETTLTSRFMMSSGNWRPVKLRTRTKLKALIAVSAPEPEQLQHMKLAPVDFNKEVAGVKRALSQVERDSQGQAEVPEPRPIAVRMLGGPGSPFTVDRLLDALRDGVDILYLVSHGMFGRKTGTPALVLQDEEGHATTVKGEKLTTRVAELQRPPQLMVLASCQSAGDGEQVQSKHSTTVQATLAGRLADAGVPAVIAMQGYITMHTVETMMPVFFTELLHDGQIDRALSVARGKVRSHDDWWMPALYSRLTSGRLWSVDEHISPTNSLAALLKAAYERRAELKIAGKDTTKVNTEILELRRKQRHGPTLHIGEFMADGRFRLIKVIGRGGFARIWKAYDQNTDRFVAIKVLHGQFVEDASRRERLFRGARRMATLQHPNVVQVLVPNGEEQGFYYYVMEYLAGGDLHRAIIEKRLDVDKALGIIEEIAGALEAAHQQGLVHRDVKPQNILLREDGTPVLSDFDLVQAQDTTGGTRTGALGTVLYAAPEQNEDASQVDHRAEIYSLGMTAVFCVYGKKLPNRAMYRLESFLARLKCNDYLRTVLQRAVALEPDDRFESMAIFRSDIAQARRARRAALSVSLRVLVEEARDAVVLALRGNRGSREHALELVGEILQRDAQNSDAIALARTLASQSGDPDPIIELLASAFARVTDGDLRYELALFLGEYAATQEIAVRYYEAAAKAKPDGRRALRGLVNGYRQMGDNRRAAEATERLLWLFDPSEPSTIDLRMGLASFMSTDPQTLPRAIEHARLVLQARSDDPRAIQLMAELLTRADRRAEAARLLDRLAARERNRERLHDIYLRKAKLLAEVPGAETTALQAVERAAAINPGNRETISLLMDQLNRTNQSARVASYLQPIRSALVSNVGRGAVSLRDLGLLATVSRRAQPQLARMASALLRAMEPAPTAIALPGVTNTPTKVGIRQVLDTTRVRVALYSAGEPPLLHRLLQTLDSIVGILFGFTTAELILPPGVDLDPLTSFAQRCAAFLDLPTPKIRSLTSSVPIVYLSDPSPTLGIEASLLAPDNQLATRGLIAIAMARAAFDAPRARALSSQAMNLLLAAAFDAVEVLNPMTANPDPKHLKQLASHLGKALSHNQRHTLERQCQGLANHDFDAIARAVQSTDLHMAALLCEDPGPVLASACLLDGVTGGGLKQRVSRSGTARELLAHMLSDAFLTAQMIASEN